MSTARPYYLIARSQLDRIATELPASLDELCARWWPDGAAVAATVGRGDDTDIPASALGCLLRSGEHWLVIAADERDWRALAGAWLGASVGADSPLARALQRTFCGELFATLAGVAPPEAAAPAVLCPREWQALREPGSGAVYCRLRLDETPLTLLSGPSLWPALSAKSARSPQPLTPCHAALGQARVRLQVSLPRVRVPLTDLAGLAPGDFLRLGLDLSGGVVLHGENVDLTLPGSIGRRGDRKAVQLDAVAGPTATTGPAPQPFSSTRTPAGQTHERQ